MRATATRSLETRRLRLDWLTVDDDELMLAVWNDPRFIKFVGDRGVRTTGDARAALESGSLKLFESHGIGPYRVSLKSSGEAIGTCGLFKREYLTEPDLGFALLPEFSGVGYGWESADCVVRHVRDDLGMSRLTAIVSPANAPSIGLIEKLGMRFEEHLRIPGEDHDVSLYGVDWAQGKSWDF